MDFISKLASLLQQFPASHTFNLNSKDAQNVVYHVYIVIDTLLMGKKPISQIFSSIFQAETDSPSINYIKTRSFLSTLLEKTLFWLELELFYCKTLVISLNSLLFLEEDETPQVKYFFQVINEFVEKSDFRIEKTPFVMEFEAFLYKKAVISKDFEAFQQQWLALLQEKTQENIIFSQNPMLLNLSDGGGSSSHDSEDFSPIKQEKIQKKSNKISQSQKIFAQLYKEDLEKNGFYFETHASHVRISLIYKKYCVL